MSLSGFLLRVRELFVVLLMLTACRALTAQNAAIKVETFGAEESPHTVVVLHGSAGPDRYRSDAKALAAAGFYVLFPHFYEAARSQTASYANYQAWVRAVDGIVKSRVQARPESKVSLFGISLGASVALALGTQSAQVTSVVEWSGSLPDDYFEHLQRLPPLLILHGAKDTNVPVMNAQQLLTLCQRLAAKCENRIFEDQQHVFDEATQTEAERLSENFLRRDWPPGAAVSVSGGQAQ